MFGIRAVMGLILSPQAGEFSDIHVRGQGSLVRLELTHPMTIAVTASQMQNDMMMQAQMGAFLPWCTNVGNSFRFCNMKFWIWTYDSVAC